MAHENGPKTWFKKMTQIQAYTTLYHVYKTR